MPDVRAVRKLRGEAPGKVCPPVLPMDESGFAVTEIAPQFWYRAGQITHMAGDARGRADEAGQRKQGEGDAAIGQVFRERTFAMKNDLWHVSAWVEILCQQQS